MANGDTLPAIVEETMRARVISVLGAALLLSSAANAAMTIESTDVSDGGKIALKQVYTRCGGKNVSPALSWSGAPSGTKGFAVTLIDLSVKPSDWSHWIVVNLPADTASLASGVSALPGGAQQVETNFGDARYDGPCPPIGSGVHQYQLTVWALGPNAPTITANESADAVMDTLQKAALDKASLTGTFERK